MNKEFKVIDFIADGENVRILKVQNLSDLKYYAIKIIYRTKDNIQYINNEINILRKIRNKITKIRNIAKNILIGLSSLHKIKIIHGDINPANILLYNSDYEKKI